VKRFYFLNSLMCQRVNELMTIQFQDMAYGHYSSGTDLKTSLSCNSFKHFSSWEETQVWLFMS